MDDNSNSEWRKPVDQTDKRRLCTMHVPPELTSLLLAERMVESVCLQAGSSDKETTEIVLAVSEVLCNVIDYGCLEDSGEEITVEAILVNKSLFVLINDPGIEVPEQVVRQLHEHRVSMPSIDVDSEDLPVSGWGVNIVLMTAKRVRYQRINNGNSTELEFQLGGKIQATA